MPAVDLSAIKPQDIIDVSDYPQRGEALHDLICGAVKDTQAGALLLPLPWLLFVNAEQFKSLDPLGQMPRMSGSADRIYQTPLNVMEVHVKDNALPSAPPTNTLSEIGFEV
jgi:hypothetical protein